MKSNLCVIGLAPNFTKNISKILADKLGMRYASVNEMLEFDLGSVIEARELVGTDYVEKLENQKIKTLLSFENAIIAMDIGTFVRGDNSHVVEKYAYTIFLDLPQGLIGKLYKKQEEKPVDFDVQMMVHDERSEFCRRTCDFDEQLICLDKRKIADQILRDLALYKY